MLLVDGEAGDVAEDLESVDGVYVVIAVDIAEEGGCATGGHRPADFGAAGLLVRVDAGVLLERDEGVDGV